VVTCLLQVIMQRQVIQGGPNSDATLALADDLDGLKSENVLLRGQVS
jgi:hypothetical protein